MSERELLTVQESARRACVSVRAIYNWLRQGKVEHVRTAGGSVRIFADTLHSTPTREFVGRPHGIARRTS